MHSGACSPNTHCCSHCSLALVTARARVAAGVKLPTRNDELNLDETLVAFLRASADGKSLWLEDEDDTAIPLEGVSPAPQTLNRMVQVLGGQWKLFHSGSSSSGNSCILSAAVSVLEIADNLNFCPSALSLIRGPLSLEVSLPPNEPVGSVRELFASSRSRKRDRHGVSMSRRKLTWLKGRVVALSPVIQTPEAPPVCFLILEDTAGCAPRSVQGTSSHEPLPRITLVLSGSTLKWRRFMSCGDIVVVTAVHTKHSKLEVASNNGGSGSSGVDRFVAFATTEARRVNPTETGAPLPDLPQDWVTVAHTETIVMRIAPSSDFLYNDAAPSRDGPGVLSSPTSQRRHLPKLDESVVHYTGTITGAFPLTSLDERGVGGSAKHLIIKLDNDGTLLFLQHWPLLPDAAAAAVPSTPASDSPTSSSSSLPAAPAWVSWLTAGTILQLRHVHPVHMWGKLRGYAACAATEITPLLGGAHDNAPAIAPSAMDETVRISPPTSHSISSRNVPSSASVGTPPWTASAAKSLGKAYCSRSGVECCSTLAWARLVERNLDDKRNALGGTAWTRQAAVAIRRAAAANKTLPAPVHHSALPLEFLHHASACHVVAGELTSSNRTGDTTILNHNGFSAKSRQCCSSTSRWPLVPTVAALRKHLKSRRGGWQRHIAKLVKRHNRAAASKADARAAGRDESNSKVVTDKSAMLAGQCWILRFYATSNVHEELHNDDSDDTESDNDEGYLRGRNDVSHTAVNMSAEAPSESEDNRDNIEEGNDDATWRGAHLVGRCYALDGQTSPLLRFNDGTGEISLALTTQVNRHSSSLSSSSHEGVEDLRAVVRRFGVPYSELLGELPRNSSGSSYDETVVCPPTVLRLTNFRVVTEILHLEAQSSNSHTHDAAGHQHRSHLPRETASETAPGSFTVHHGGQTFLVTHLVQCCGNETGRSMPNSNVEVITPEQDYGSTSTPTCQFLLNVPPLGPFPLAPVLTSVTNAPSMLATVLQKGIRYSSVAIRMPPAQDSKSTSLSSSLSSSSSLSFSRLPSDSLSMSSSSSSSSSSTKPLQSPLQNKELIFRCRFLHEPREFDLLVPYGTSVSSSSSLQGLIPGSLIAIQGARLDLSDFKRSPVLTFTLLPSASLRLIALPPVVAPAALAQCDAMQVDWRALPPAPPLASFIGSSTTTPVLPPSSTPQLHIVQSTPANGSQSTATTTSSLPSSWRAAASSSSSLSLLRLRFTIIHVAFAAVHPNTCAVCGMPPYAPPPSTTKRQGGIMPPSSSLLGLPCRRSQCRGVTSNRCGWEFSCIADDGTAKAVIRADGSAAVTLIYLPARLTKSLEDLARLSGQQVLLTSTATPPPPRYREAVAAALTRAKGRTVIGCCAVVGSRLENTLAPLRAARAAEDLAAGIQPTANASSASSTSGRGLADGWTCHKCKNRNFPSRLSCNSCRAAKPPSSSSSTNMSSSSGTNSITADSSYGSRGNTSTSSVVLEASTAEAGDVKWTTAALPRLELKCFNADVVDSQLEAHLSLLNLTQNKN